MATVEPPSPTGITTPSSSLHFQQLTANNQEVIWQGLKYAAHETSDVRNMALLQPYGQDFGKLPGDVGVAAMMMVDNKDDNDNDRPTVVVGAAWIRDMAQHGGSSSNDNKNGSSNGNGGFCVHGQGLPELAMAVFPPNQGKGIGTQLLQHLLDQVRQQGNYPGVCLSCRTDNAPAMRLYQKVGFVRVRNSEQTNRAGGTSVDMLCYFDEKAMEE